MAIEDIEQRLKADAEKAAARLLDEARRKAAESLEKAADDGRKQHQRAVNAAGDEASAARQAGLSQAGLKARKELLQRKRQLIEDAFQAAAAGLKGLPDESYAALLAEMIVGGALKDDMELILDDGDGQRLPAGFEEDVNTRLAEAGKGRVHLSSETKSLGGGFVLACGGIEVNGSLPALMRGLRADLEPGVIERLGFK